MIGGSVTPIVVLSSVVISSTIKFTSSVAPNTSQIKLSKVQKLFDGQVMIKDFESAIGELWTVENGVIIEVVKVTQQSSRNSKILQF